MERAREIEERTRAVYEAMGRGDSGFIREYVAGGADVVGIGTDPSEYWLGETFATTWAQQIDELGGVGGLTFEDAAPVGYSDGNVGWVADKPTVVMPDGTKVPIRVTAVYRRDGGDWKAVQWHASIGVANEEAIGTELTTDSGETG